MCAAYFNPDSSTSQAAPSWSRTPWGAIMMGAVTAIGVQFLFSVLGLALGVSASADADLEIRPSVRTIPIIAGVWWLISGGTSLFIGGWVLGRVSSEARGVPLKLASMTMWGVAALVGLVVIWSGASMALDSPLATLYARAPLPEQRDVMSMTVSNAPIRVGARDATRAASWWTAVGLIGGLGASIAGAVLGARTAKRWTESNAASPLPVVTPERDPARMAGLSHREPAVQGQR